MSFDSAQMSSLLKTVRSKVSGDRARHEEEGFNLDLTYVVPRIIGKYDYGKTLEKISTEKKNIFFFPLSLSNWFTRMPFKNKPKLIQTKPPKTTKPCHFLAPVCKPSTATRWPKCVGS
jgi:hypothetical protein